VGKDHFEGDGGVGKVRVFDLESEDVGDGGVELEFALLHELHNGDGTEAFGGGGDSEESGGIDGLVFLVFIALEVAEDGVTIFPHFQLNTFKVSGADHLVDLDGKILCRVASGNYSNGNKQQNKPNRHDANSIID
jgi:hypothetical protein